MSKQKEHGHEELLRYMHLLEKGYSACSIYQQYGINSELRIPDQGDKSAREKVSGKTLA